MKFFRVNLAGKSTHLPEQVNLNSGIVRKISASITRGAVGIYIGNDSNPLAVFRQGNSSLDLTIDSGNTQINLKAMAGELYPKGTLHFEL